MSTAGDGETCDCIVVGSGTSCAVIAREPSGRGQKVLILEQRPYLPLKKKFWTFKPMFKKEHGSATDRAAEVQTEVQEGIVG